MPPEPQVPPRSRLIVALDTFDRVEALRLVSALRGGGAAIRSASGESVVTVVPGIRPEGGAVGDQRRAATPAEAVRAGADYLVVGRPITTAVDPAVAAEAIIAEIGS